MTTMELPRLMPTTLSDPVPRQARSTYLSELLDEIAATVRGLLAPGARAEPMLGEHIERDLGLR